MKSLELNAYGVSEMNQQEVLAINGGLIVVNPKTTLEVGFFCLGVIAGFLQL